MVRICGGSLALYTGLCLISVCADSFAAKGVSGVKVEVTTISVTTGSLHWKITNESKEEVYVYDVFLLGPAFVIEKGLGTAVFYATPSSTLASCPPNRLLPPLLVVIRSGGVIEGNFADLAIKALVPRTKVSIKIAVGTEPDSVMENWGRFLRSDCKHSPYDAIVQWGAIVQSNSLRP